MSVEKRLSDLGFSLPAAPAPAANYVPTVQSGNMLYVSGQLPSGPDGLEHIGKLGQNVTIEEGAEAARLCALNILAQANAALGSLERIARLVKLTGFVNSSPDFTDQPKVINGASDFLAHVLGESGFHARSAVGVAALPFNVSVEIEAIIEISAD